MFKNISVDSIAQLQKIFANRFTEVENSHNHTMTWIRRGERISEQILHKNWSTSHLNHFSLSSGELIMSNFWFSPSHSQKIFSILELEQNYTSIIIGLRVYRGQTVPLHVDDIGDSSPRMTVIISNSGQINFSTDSDNIISVSGQGASCTFYPKNTWHGARAHDQHLDIIQYSLVSVQ